MNFKDVFVRILKDNGVYRAYFANFEKLERYGVSHCYSGLSFNKFVENYVQIRFSGNFLSEEEKLINTFYLFINDSFDWEKTKEKFDFWSMLSKKMKTIGEKIVYGEMTTHEEKEYIDGLKKILYKE